MSHGVVEKNVFQMFFIVSSSEFCWDLYWPSYQNVSDELSWHQAQMP